MTFYIKIICSHGRHYCLCCYHRYRHHCALHIHTGWKSSLDIFWPTTLLGCTKGRRSNVFKSLFVWREMFSNRSAVIRVLSHLPVSLSDGTEKRRHPSPVHLLHHSPLLQQEAAHIHLPPARRCCQCWREETRYHWHKNGVIFFMRMTTANWGIETTFRNLALNTDFSLNSELSFITWDHRIRNVFRETSVTSDLPKHICLYTECFIQRLAAPNLF